MSTASHPISDKAALRGEPSYVWRAGQERRLAMLRAGAGERITGIMSGGWLRGWVNTCPGWPKSARLAVGLDIELERAIEAHQKTPAVTCGNGEKLPFPPDQFDLVLSHEVIEHVGDDRAAIQ